MVGYGSPRVTQQQIKAQQEAFDKRERETYQDGLKEHHSDVLRYNCETASNPIQTEFSSMDLDTMKGMLANVDAEGVKQVGHHWQKVHDDLVSGGDSAHSQLKRAVDNVMEHWEGESANQFRRQADKILQQIQNTATHAHTMSKAVHQTGVDLGKCKSHLDSMENPGWLSSAWDSLTDSGRSDKYTQEDLKAGRLPPDVLAEVNEGYMSEQDETNLKAATVMETLARSYVGTTRHLQSSKGYDDGTNDIPPSTPSVPMPTPIPPFSGSSSTPSTGNPSLNQGNFSTGKKPPEPKLLRDMGVHGGEQLPLTKTKIDGLQQGITGHSGPETFSNGTPTPRGGTTGPGPMGTPNVPGVQRSRLPGGSSGGRTAGRLPGSRSGVRGGIGSGASERSTNGGRSGGMRGMHGMGGGGGAGGKGGAAGGRGPLARAKGGIAGAPKGITGAKGPVTAGGTGLGKGRGGGASEAGGRGGRGMFAGGMRGSNQRPFDEENEEGSRPDYLVEDEETWTPEDSRSVPRNIE